MSKKQGHATSAGAKKSAGSAQNKSSDPLSNALKTTPSGPAIVYQGRLPLYNMPGNEALFAATVVSVDHVENNQIQHWFNSSDQTQKYTVTYTTELKVTQGQEFGASVNLGASFEGISIGTSFETKTLSSTETTKSQTKTLEVTVPPKSDLWFYQRKYVLRAKMTWILDAWGQLWNVGSVGGYHVQQGECVSEISTEDYVTTTKQLQKTQSVKFNSLPAKNQAADTTRKWENTTDKCKSTLQAIGINGTQQD